MYILAYFLPFSFLSCLIPSRGGAYYIPVPPSSTRPGQHAVAALSPVPVHLCVDCVVRRLAFWLRVLFLYQKSNLPPPYSTDRPFILLVFEEEEEEEEGKKMSERRDAD